MPPSIQVWMVVVVVVVGAVVIDRLALAAERRGWVRWRRSPPPRSSVSTAMLSVQALFEPDRQHVVEQRAHEDLEMDLADDDEPIAGGSTSDVSGAHP